jgi:small subunit ribosomal protein S4e
MYFPDFLLLEHADIIILYIFLTHYFSFLSFSYFLFSPRFFFFFFYSFIMPRGPKKHLKRLAAPSSWMLDKMGGIYAPRPSSGPHKLNECIPMVLVLRNRLKYALTRREVLMICMRRLVQVDGKIRSDINFPCGFQDVITLPKSGENFRVFYDTKGRFTLHPISEKEAGYKLCRVSRVARGNKASSGHNPFLVGQKKSIPYITTHDGRTIRYPDPDVRVNDTVKVDIATGKMTEFVPFAIGNLVISTRGSNAGRIGVVEHIERHPGTYTIVHIKDRREHQFATRVENIFVLGKGTNPMCSLPKQKGIKLSIVEERVSAAKKAAAGKKKKRSA